MSDSEIMIDHEGQWYYNGSKMFRLPAVSFLASHLKKVDDSYFICFQGQQVPVTVEDVPFVITTTSKSEDGLKGTLADGREVAIPEREILLENDVPYFSLFGERDCKFSRPAFWQIVEYLVEKDGQRVISYQAL